MKTDIEIIAEAGISFQADMKKARELILRAKETGCQTWKCQAYDPEKVFPDHQVMVNGKNYWEFVKRSALTKDQILQLAQWCREAEIEFLASCFDLERFGWLETAGVARFKVANRFKDVAVIQAIAATNKPILASMPLPLDSTAYSLVPLFPRKRTTFLYCESVYPTPLGKLAIRRIRFGQFYGGFSDHSQGVAASIAAIARGAKIVEKHCCLKRDERAGPDMVCSLEPSEMASVVAFARAWETMG